MRSSKLYSTRHELEWTTLNLRSTDILEHLFFNLLLPFKGTEKTVEDFKDRSKRLLVVDEKQNKGKPMLF